MARTNFSLLLGLVLFLPWTAVAQPALDGTWTAEGETRSFQLVEQEDGSHFGTTSSPGLGWQSELTLRGEEGSWELEVDQRVRETRGLIGGVRRHRRPGRWEHRVTRVDLERDGDALVAGTTWRIVLPLEAESVEPAEVAPVHSSSKPRVRVLITGFDRFPKLSNHPRWVSDGTPLDGRTPRINPAGWVVRQFDPEQDLSEEFREEVEIELHRLNDLPVVYVEGARLVTDAIERLRPDVVISFGVGADWGADADVETRCENLMDDVNEYGLEELGPFQLPTSWPPEGSRRDWDEEDQAWFLRYPDNAGVSYNGRAIDEREGAPDTLESTLPVKRIIARVKRARLKGIDGGSGPGRYICNNVMYRVIQAQTAHGRLGGFIHLPSWRESRRDDYKQVVAAAIEESAREHLAQRTADGLPGPTN